MVKCKNIMVDLEVKMKDAKKPGDGVTLEKKRVVVILAAEATWTGQDIRHITQAQDLIDLCRARGMEDYEFRQRRANGDGCHVLS